MKFKMEKSYSSMDKLEYCTIHPILDRTDNLEINPDTIKEAVYTVGEKAQDRTVGDYDSTLANDMRKIIIDRMSEGMSMSEARAWVNKRYGSNL